MLYSKFTINMQFYKAVYYSKYIIIILVKVLLFGLLLSLSASDKVESKCNYYQSLETGITYYVYNPEFPNKYKGENHCRWNMESSDVVKINCTLDMDNDCNRSGLKFYFKDKIYKQVFIDRICGYTSFVIEGIIATIEFDSQNNSKEGRFLCGVKTVNNNCQCGWKKVTRIVGGKETGVNEYPMMGGLVDVEKKMIYCGCTIISEQYVLTAAHCLDKKNINEIGVVVGEHDTSTGKETNATRFFRLSKSIIHPQYQGDKIAYNDIAVCKILGRIEYSDKVGPACLPFKKEQNHDNYDDNIVTALGWGLKEFGGSPSTTLQKVDLNVISSKKCKDFYNISNSNMCTYTPGKDTCQMDSGGPLLWENASMRIMVLIGITTAGFGCASGMPAVSMHTGSFIDWILNVTPDAKYCRTE